MIIKDSKPNCQKDEVDLYIILIYKKVFMQNRSCIFTFHPNLDILSSWKEKCFQFRNMDKFERLRSVPI